MTTNDYETSYVFTYSEVVDRLGKSQQNYLMFKRICDFTLALILFLPAMLIVSIAGLMVILESEGGAFYTQIRSGKNCRPFRIYKLRSMYLDSEKHGPKWASVNDDRVTKVGRIIRKFRIDELPQIVNVMMGEMSFIGPRPERPELIEEFCQTIPNFSIRNAVLPGISGLAQVSGGYDLSPNEKLKIDIEYIERISFKTDIGIIFKTLKVLLTCEGAR